MTIIPHRYPRLPTDILRGNIPRRIEIELDKYAPDLLYRQTLLRLYSSSGTTRVYDMIRWDDKGIRIWRQEEGCMHIHMLSGPFNLTWDKLERLRKADQASSLIELSMTEETLAKLLRLKGKSYENKGDAKAIRALLSEN